jgi:hypothetical protein
MIPAGSLERLSKPRGSIRVELEGGCFTASTETEMDLVIPRHKGNDVGVRPVMTLTTWTAEVDSGSYQIDSATPKPFSSGMELYVYNWDRIQPNPKPARLRQRVRRADVPPEFADLDAKWIYRTLRPTGGLSWAEWLDGELLPVTHTQGYTQQPCRHKHAGKGIRAKKIPHNPPTGTCDNLTFIEDE